MTQGVTCQRIASHVLQDAVPAHTLKLAFGKDRIDVRSNSAELVAKHNPADVAALGARTRLRRCLAIPCAGGPRRAPCDGAERARGKQASG